MADRCRVARDVSNKAGLEFDVAKDIREIAISHIEEAEGNISLAEVVKKTKADVPGIQDVDVWNSLGNRIEVNEQRQIDAVKEQQARLSKQAKLEAEVEDALNGIFEKQERGEKLTSQEIQTLRDSLRKLQGEVAKNIKDEAQKARILKEIEETRELLRNDVIRVDPKQDAKVQKQTDGLREELADLKKQVATRVQIQNLETELSGIEQEIATPKPDGTAKGSAELQALRQRRDDLKAELKVRKSLQQKISDLEGQLNDQPRQRAKKGETPVNSQVVQSMKDEITELRLKIAQKKESDREVLETAKEEKRIQDQIAKIDAEIDAIETETRVVKKKEKADVDPRLQEARQRKSDALKKKREEHRETLRVIQAEKRVQDEVSRINKEIQDIKDDIRVMPKAKKGDVDPRIEAAREEKRKLLQQKREEAREILKAVQADKKKQDTLADIEQRIADIEAGNTPMPKPRKSADPEVAEARKRYREALKVLKTKNAIEDLKKQILDREYRQRVQMEREAKKGKRAEISDEMIRLQLEKKNLQQTVNDLIERNRERTLLEKMGRPFVELNLAFRGLILSGELGFVGRQTVTWFLNPFYTMKTARNIAKTVIQGFAERGAARVNAELQQHPDFIDAQRSGLFFRDLDHEFTASEESTQSWLLRKVWGLRQFIALNDRLMSTYINLMTHDMYFSYLETAPNATREQKKSMAKLINASAGRGQALGVERWGNYAKHIMLAPRFMISRFEAPMRGAGIAFGKDASAADRIFIAKQWGGFFATGATLLGLASMLPGVEIGDDPEDSDFLKIIWGDKRIDIWGGFLQPAQLFGRMILGMGRFVGVVDDKKKWNARDAKEELGNFLGNRMSPLANVFNIAYSRETFDREKIPSLMDAATDTDDAKEFAQKFILPQVSPIIGQETVDAYDLEGIESAAVSFGLNMIGVGTSTYDKK